MERDKYHYRRCDNCGLKWIISCKLTNLSSYICPYCSTQQGKDELKHDETSTKNKLHALGSTFEAGNANE